MLPNENEWKGSFPENLDTNIQDWLTSTIWRKIALFNESFSIEWILSLLSHIFFLLLLRNIKNAVSKITMPDGETKSDQKELEKLNKRYFGWAVSSLLITIVFISKFTNQNNITTIAAGILGLAASIFVLLFIQKWELLYKKT